MSRLRHNRNASKQAKSLHCPVTFSTDCIKTSESTTAISKVKGKMRMKCRKKTTKEKMIFIKKINCLMMLCWMDLFWSK